MSVQKLTIRSIRSTDKERLGKQGDHNLKYNLWGRYVLREASYYPAWFFLKLGFSANMVTTISIVIGIIGCVFIAIGSYTWMIAGILLFILWAVLDYADGQVARYRHSSSNYGRFLDFLGDSSISILLFICLGISLYNHPDNVLNSLFRLFSTGGLNRSIFLILGGWASVAYIFPLMIGYQFDRIFQKDFSGVADQLKAGKLPAGFVQKVGYNMHNTTGLIMPVLLLAVIFKFASLIIFIWTLIGTFTSVFMSVQMLRKARVSISQK